MVVRSPAWDFRTCASTDPRGLLPSFHLNDLVSGSPAPDASRKQLHRNTLHSAGRDVGSGGGPAAGARRTEPVGRGPARAAVTGVPAAVQGLLILILLIAGSANSS